MPRNNYHWRIRGRLYETLEHDIGIIAWITVHTGWHRNIVKQQYGNYQLYIVICARGFMRMQQIWYTYLISSTQRQRQTYAQINAALNYVIYLNYVIIAWRRYRYE